MKTVPQIESEIADYKARPKTDSVQKRIEHLERQRAQILSADRKDIRKLKARATFILGSAVIEAAEEVGEQALADWLRQRVSALPAKDRNLVRSALPQIFSSSKSSSTHAERPLPAQPAAHVNEETHDE